MLVSVCVCDLGCVCIDLLGLNESNLKKRPQITPLLVSPFLFNLLPLPTNLFPPLTTTTTLLLLPVSFLVVPV